MNELLLMPITITWWTLPLLGMVLNLIFCSLVVLACRLRWMSRLVASFLVATFSAGSVSIGCPMGALPTSEPLVILLTFYPLVYLASSVALALPFGLVGVAGYLVANRCLGCWQDRGATKVLGCAQHSSVAAALLDGQPAEKRPVALVANVDSPSTESGQQETVCLQPTDVSGGKVGTGLALVRKRKSVPVWCQMVAMTATVAVFTYQVPHWPWLIGFANSNPCSTMAQHVLITPLTEAAKTIFDWARKHTH